MWYKKLKSILYCHHKQIEILRHLIYEHDDTLFIACTDFEKNCIFHFYTILIEKIIIQLISFNNLEKQQLTSIAKISEVNSCLIIKDIKSKHSNLLNQIQQKVYIHIFMSLKQAFSKQVKQILMTANLQVKIDLIVVDECHLIKQ